MGHFIDVERWKRREHFQLYRDFQQPFFNVGAQLDATELWRKSRKPGGSSFFLATIYAALEAVNAIEPFRLRLRDGGVWVHERVSITPTVLRRDETFGFVRLDLAQSYRQFAVESTAAIRAACEVKPLVSSHPDDDVVFQTTLPWIRFTAFSNALPGGADSVPRIAFGKCSPAGKRWLLPVSVEVHHALVDGLDVARFLERMEASCASIAESEITVR